MKKLWLLFVYLLFLFPVATSAKDLSSMYDPGTLERERPRFEKRVGDMLNKAIRPLLTPEESARLSEVSLDFPLIDHGGDAMDFHRVGPTVTTPIMSLLFFEALCTAYAWLQYNGNRLETIEEYVTMLKYKDARGFGGRFLPPLKALGIPPNAASDRRVDELSLRLRNDGYGFILAHELGHVLHRHRRNQQVSIQQQLQQSVHDEEEADQFAFDIMRRNGAVPLGAMLFFQVAVFYFPNRADFESDEQWQKWVKEKSDHPLTPHRLELMAQRLSDTAPDFARLDSNKAATTEIARFIGKNLVEFAEFLNDPDLQRVMRKKAEDFDVSSLFPRRERETLKDFPPGRRR